MNGSAANFTKIAIYYYRAVPLLSHGAIIIVNTIANAKTNKNTNICGTYYVQMQIQIQECKVAICPLVVDTWGHQFKRMLWCGTTEWWLLSD